MHATSLAHIASLLVMLFYWATVTKSPTERQRLILLCTQAA